MGSVLLTSHPIVLLAAQQTYAGFSVADVPGSAQGVEDPLMTAAKQQAPSPSSPSASSGGSAWDVQLSDGTYRKLVARWAARAGWTAIWDVDNEIPLIGSSPSMGDTFTNAMLELGHSTDSTDTPIHPCFYTNNLVRVVPNTVACDPENE